jgi:hypothetical protein
MHGVAAITAVRRDGRIAARWDPVRHPRDRHRRGLEAYRAGDGHGGRYVPPELIRKSAGAGPKSVNRQAFETVRHKFSQWDVYDNSVHGRNPVHIEGSHR